jgi:hypothetical protein
VTKEPAERVIVLPPNVAVIVEATAIASIALAKAASSVAATPPTAPKSSGVQTPRE